MDQTLLHEQFQLKDQKAILVIFVYLIGFEFLEYVVFLLVQAKSERKFE